MNKLTRSLLVLSTFTLMLSSCDMEHNDDPASVSSDENSNEFKKEIRDISSIELVQEMRTGWNLGNTLDVLSYDQDLTVEQYETYWGNVKTTPEIIKAVSDAGFNVLRIPVSWEEHLSSDGKYTIDPKWLDRVNEIVDYGLNNDMFVIINTHHENWIFTDSSHYEQNKDELTKIWTQIGKRFKNYNEKLLFEGMNEPRQPNTPTEWIGGDDEGHKYVNELNKVFIDTIRSLGGNNKKRHLLIPTYAASYTEKAIDALKLPDDDKIIVSIHAYVPYDFTMNKTGTDKWNKDDSYCTADIDNLMNKLKTAFIDKGYPVIIGETGAVNKNNTKDRADWSEYYLHAAKSKGIPCIWWDNGYFLGNGESFGLFSRDSECWIFKDILNSILTGTE